MNWLNALFSRSEPEHEPARGDALRLAEVEAVLERLRPAFRADGGDIRLVEVDQEGVVFVELHGACNSCHASDATLHGALEPELRRTLAWVRELRAV